MSTATTSIPVEEAEDYIYGEAVAMQLVSEHRWYDKQLVVFRAGSGLYGFYYDRPATEEQEGMDVFEADPVPIFPVVAKEITTVVYEREEVTK